jgi:hypothetical protein
MASGFQQPIRPCYSRAAAMQKFNVFSDIGREVATSARFAKSQRH